MSARIILYVDNLKCGGCEKTVHNILSDISGLENLEVRANNGEVSFDNFSSTDLNPLVIGKLSQAGYPPIGEADMLDKAKSYVSCMKGKLSHT